MKFSVDDFDRLVKANKKNSILANDSGIAYNSSSNRISIESGFDSAISESTSLERKVPEEHEFQKKIRDMFNKSKTLNTSTIGEHQEFLPIMNGGSIYRYACSLFIDIKGSTRLSLIYDDLSLIYEFKNAVIKTCIETIRAFDGCVHRIMGDAVLGFFGSSSLSKEQSILDCVNAAALLTIILDQLIKPWLQSVFPNFNSDHFGFRIGCNFGDDEEILWSNYGYGKVGEISPTGLPVDLAAKLQGLASKNKIMLGEGLLKKFNWPENFSSIKTKSKNGELSVEQLFIEPNYTKKDGSKLNYVMRELNIHKYVLGLPIPNDLKNSFLTKNYSLPEHKSTKVIDHAGFVLNVQIINENKNSEKYISGTKIIPKFSQIKISISPNTSLPVFKKYIVKFTKINQEGFNNEPELLHQLNPENIKCEIDCPIYTNPLGGSSVHFERSCSFRGMHYVKCEIFLKENLNEAIFRDYVFVPIN